MVYNNSPMSIVTKRGDGGNTFLFWGGEVAKDHPRIELQGALDELSSFLGLAKSLIKKGAIKDLLEQIQKDLILIGAEVSTAPRFIHRLKKKILRKDVRQLEAFINKLEAKRAFKKEFCLPGANTASGALHVARTIARRAERRVVSLVKKEELKDSAILVYMNRLSDLLYLAARACAKKER